MTFSDVASLALAYSDLKVVQDVVNAINANLPKTGPLGTIPAATRSLDPRPRLRATPEEQFNARFKNTSSNDVDAVRERQREVDRYEPSKHCDPLPQTIVLEPYKRSKSPIQPIWATLPPVPHVTTDRVVKVVHQKVDLLARGTMLDLFV